MRSKALSWGAKFLFGIFAKANLEKIKWPKSYLAKRMDCKIREVFERIKELEENNLILVDRTLKGKVNTYRINLELISIIQERDAQMHHTQNTPGRVAHSMPGGDAHRVPAIKEHILKNNTKESVFNNLNDERTVNPVGLKRYQLIKEKTPIKSL